LKGLPVANVSPVTRVGKQPLRCQEMRARAMFALFLLGIGLIIAILPVKFAGIFVVGSIVFVLTLVRPMYALYLIILSVPFGSLAAISLGPVSLTGTEALAGSLLFAWVLQLVAQRQGKIEFTALFWPFVAYFGALVLSSGVAESLPLSLKELSKWLEFGCLYLVAVNIIHDRRQLQNLALVIIGAAVLEAFHGWYQFFRRAGPPSFLIGGHFLRAYGTFEQPNPYAGYLGLALPIAYSLALTGSLRPASPKFRRTILALAAAAIIGVAMLMSMSRGGWLGAAAALSVVTAIRSRRSLMALVAASFLGIILILMGSFSLLPPQLVERVSIVTDYFRLFDAREVTLTPENWAIVQRMANWQSAWGMFVDHPWLGVGIGNYPVAYQAYALPQWQEPAGHAHNYYLNLAAEAGVIGLGTYLVMYLVAFLLAAQILRRLSNRPGTRAATERVALDLMVPRRITSVTADRGPGAEHQGSAHSGSGEFWDDDATKGIAIGIVGTLVAMSVHNFFDNLYVHGMAAQIGLSLGMLVVAGKVGGECHNWVKGR